MPQDDPATITRPEFHLRDPSSRGASIRRNRRSSVRWFTHSTPRCRRGGGAGKPLRRRCGASDAAVPRARDVLGAARCRQSGVETPRCPRRHRPRKAPRYLRNRTHGARACFGLELAVELTGVIQTTDPEKARQRDRDLIANPTMLRPITPQLSPGLHGDAPPPAQRARRNRAWPTARCSTIASATASRYWQLRIGRPAAAGDARQLSDGDVVTIVAEGEVAGYLAELTPKPSVIRPDRHVLGVASTPAELDAVLARRMWRAQAETSPKRAPKTAAAINPGDSVMASSRVPWIRSIMSAA